MDHTEEFTRKDCYMLSALNPCGVKKSACGFKCPFRKTLEEQQKAEAKIVERFKEIGYVGVYRSCITGEVLYRHQMYE